MGPQAPSDSPLYWSCAVWVLRPFGSASFGAWVVLVLRGYRFPLYLHNCMPRLRLFALTFALAACARSVPSVPPAADFLLVSGDSTYWITAGPSGLRVRGSPLLLAEYDDRFHELYVADDDHSYYDALLVGQSVYSRDLISDDSVQVYSDTLVDRIAAAYAAAHPDEDPLDPDDPVADRPSVSATSDVSMLDVSGPYLSIEYHADARQRPGAPFHATWRRVIDLRQGHPVSLDSVVGAAEAARVMDAARISYDAVLDSARARGSDLGEVVRLVLSQISFDPRSFSLARIGRRPAVEFAGRIAGRRDAEQALPLPPIAVDSQPWWAAVERTLPADSGVAGVQWGGAGYTIVATAAAGHADSVADIAIVDAAKHQWHVARVHVPLRRVFWLDRPRVDSTTRRALQRAFNDAALYDENARVAKGWPASPDAAVLAARYVHPEPRADSRPASHRR